MSFPNQGPAMRRAATVLALLGVTGCAITAALAADWPQWQGPNRNAISAETGLLKSWPAGGPKLVWKATNLGGNYVAPSVANGRIYGMSYRGPDEIAWALKEADGTEVWHTTIAPANHKIGYDSGSRSTPTVDGDRLYMLGVSGDLACLSAVDGKILWKKNLVTDFGGAVPGWGYSESPLVDGDKVIATPGGAQATLVALNKMTGAVIWKCAVPGGLPAGYSSVIKAVFDGQEEYIQLTDGGLIGVSAADGKLLWRYDRPANKTASISTPIYHDGMVFAASAYGAGGGVVKLARTPDGGVSATEVWFSKHMQNHHGGVILMNGYLYGFDMGVLRCLDWKTGQEMWSNPSVGKGSLTYADGELYVRSENGPIALVDANPKEYVEKGRFDQPDRSRVNSWAHPVIANGKLYISDQDNLLCYDIKK